MAVTLSLALVLAMASDVDGAVSLPEPAQRTVAFEEILPILSAKCFSCHGPETQESGLRLDLRETALIGGDSGRAIIATKSAESPLIHRVAAIDPDLVMPPDGEALAESEVGLLRAWIDQGARWPDELAGKHEKSNHWSFRPPIRPEVPAVRYPGWIRNPIDAFILSRLESEDTVPSPEADRTALLRRLTLDLIGLPPTPEEVRDFLADSSPNAYESVVDRLLASPHFGERWGRYWLDLARYADSDGYEKDLPRPHAWRYRQWVIDALNRDLPFDQFTIEQLAGDLLPDASLEQHVATGFHRNTLKNKEGGVDQEEDRVKIAKDRVNTTGTVWLGLTVGCCECHSHKYDPLTQREYYGLFAFFNNTDDVDIPAPLPQEAHEYAERKAAFDRAHEPYLRAVQEYELEKLALRQAEWEKGMAERPPAAIGWVPLDPVSYVSLGGASFAKLKDRSLLLVGASPDKDQYQIVTNTSHQPITAVRLEVIPDKSLPKNGPGRSAGGNFVLSELSLRAAPKGNPEKGVVVPLTHAAADYEQKGYPIAHSIDGDLATGWAIGAGEKEMHRRRTAIFQTQGMPTFENESTLIFSLEQLHGKSHAMGRLRLSVTTAAPDQIPSLLPDYITPLLAKRADERTQKQLERLAAYFRTVDPEYLALSLAEAEHRKQEPPSPETKAQTLAAAKESRATFVHIRGDFLRPGDEVAPHTPAVLPPLPETSSGPNRLDLARWLVHPTNPLTSRVAVNRIWQHLFGRGLVETENDFGTQGSSPTHPALLDWLATELVACGWSQKSMIKLIVTSATYRQASVSRPDLEELDPKNLLLARQNRLRLSAEVIRDLYLSASGLLKPSIGGPSVRPPLPEGIAELGYAGSVKWEPTKTDDRYRRGLYIFFQRTTPYPMLMTFDAPDSNVACTRRERSNTPLQALTTLNDPVFYECAQALGRRIMTECRGSVEERIHYAFQVCLARIPTDREECRLMELYQQLHSLCAEDPASAQAMIKGFEPAGMDPVEAATWVAMGRTILNLDEFVVRE